MIINEWSCMSINFITRYKHCTYIHMDGTINVIDSAIISKQPKQGKENQFKLNTKKIN